MVKNIFKEISGRIVIYHKVAFVVRKKEAFIE